MAETEQDIAFTEGPIDGVEIRPLKFFNDKRGWLIEIFRHDELEKDLWPVMMYVSSTLPGVARGPHEHVDQTDGFAFIGPSDFRLFLWDTRPGSPTLGHRTVVDRGGVESRGGVDPSRRRPRLSQRRRRFRPRLQRPQPALCGLGQEGAGRRDPARGRRPAEVPDGLTAAVLPEDDHGVRLIVDPCRFMVPGRFGLEHERQNPSPRHRPVARPRILAAFVRAAGRPGPRSGTNGEGGLPPGGGSAARPRSWPC